MSIVKTICSVLVMIRVPVYTMVSDRLEASKAVSVTLKPSPACDANVASDSKPSMDSDEYYTGRRCSETVNQEGTWREIRPCWGRRVCGKNDMVRTALITATVSEEDLRET